MQPVTIPASRNHGIDVLRAFGLLLLVVAHTEAPESLAIIRTFDVPLMVMISAYCYHEPKNGLWHYFVKRLKRLYIPTFIFLVIFFAFSFCVKEALPQFDFETGKIIGSFLLLGTMSIGYVWIMRVFLQIAIVLPFLNRWFRGLNCAITLTLLIGLLALQEYLVPVIEGIQSGAVEFVLNAVILYTIGYGIIAIVGLKFRNSSVRHQVVYCGTFFLLIILQLIFGAPQDFNPVLSKFPPHGLYITYGVFVGSLLIIFSKPLGELAMKNSIVMRSLEYLSKNSMWLYLWHILAIYMLIPVMDVHGFWFGRFAIVVVSMVACNLVYARVSGYLTQKVKSLRSA